MAEEIIFAFCKKHNLECYQINSKKFRFFRRRKWINIGQEITIQLEETYWDIHSRQVFPSFYDFSSNYYNVAEFIEFAQEQIYPNTDIHVIEEKELVSPEPENLKLVPEENVNEMEETEQKINISPTISFSSPNSFVKNNPPYYGTLSIITCIILIYLLMVLSSQTGNVNSSVMRKWGANHDLLVSNGEIHRLLISIFLHFNFLHLIANVISFYLIGFFVEKWLQSKYFILHFTFIGFIAASFSFYFHDGLYILGSSGAIFGVLGLCLYCILTNKFPKEIRSPIVFISVVLSINLAIITINGNPSIDHVGHLAGLSFGLIYGGLIDLSKKNLQHSTLNYHFIPPMVATTLAFILVRFKPDDYYQYQNLMKKIDLYHFNTKYVAENYYYIDSNKVMGEIEYAIESYDKLQLVTDTIISLRVPLPYKEVALQKHKELEPTINILYTLKKDIPLMGYEKAVYELELKKKGIKLE